VHLSKHEIISQNPLQRVAPPLLLVDGIAMNRATLSNQMPASLAEGGRP
jgi:hypothetical protein